MTFLTSKKHHFSWFLYIVWLVATRWRTRHNPIRRRNKITWLFLRGTPADEYSFLIVTKHTWVFDENEFRKCHKCCWNKNRHEKWKTQRSRTEIQIQQKSQDNRSKSFLQGNWKNSIEFNLLSQYFKWLKQHLLKSFLWQYFQTGNGRGCKKLVLEIWCSWRREIVEEAGRYPGRLRLRSVQNGSLCRSGYQAMQRQTIFGYDQ